MKFPRPVQFVWYISPVTSIGLLSFYLLIETEKERERDRKRERRKERERKRERERLRKRERFQDSA